MTKTFWERYMEGETRQVYDEIMALEGAAFKEEYYSDILAVLHETFRRTAYNLAVIHTVLSEMNYNFCKETEYNWQRPLVSPLPGTDELLLHLEKMVEPYHVPLSFKVFYSKVGACNFAWDYQTNDEIPWVGADPIQIVPLDTLLSEIGQSDQDEDEYKGLRYLELSADYFHKDNISGGSPYTIETTERPSIDARFNDDDHETSFIDYLRITFENCGFARGEYIADKEFLQFVERTRPRLLPI